MKLHRPSHLPGKPSNSAREPIPPCFLGTIGTRNRSLGPRAGLERMCSWVPLASHSPQTPLAGVSHARRYSETIPRARSIRRLSDLLSLIRLHIQTGKRRGQSISRQPVRFAGTSSSSAVAPTPMRDPPKLVDETGPTPLARANNRSAFNRTLVLHASLFQMPMARFAYRRKDRG